MTRATTIDLGVAFTGIAVLAIGIVLKDSEARALGFVILGAALPRPSEVVQRAKTMMQRRKA